MKYQLQLLIFILLCLAGRLDASPLYDYGLYLKSHAVPAPENMTRGIVEESDVISMILRQPSCA